KEGGVGEGCGERGDRRGKKVEALLAGELLRRVFGPQSLRGQRRPRRLVEALLQEADRERSERLLVPGGERGDGGRVDAAGEEDAHRHVGDQPLRDRLVEQIEELLPGVGGRVRQRRRYLPVPAQPEAALVEDRHVRGRQLADVLVDAQGRRQVLAGEVLDQRFRVERARHATVCDQRLQLGGEDAPVILYKIVERLLAQPVPRQHQLARPRVPDREREHAVDVLGELLPPL